TGIGIDKEAMQFDKAPEHETYYLQCIRDSVDELLRVEQLDMAQVKVILPPLISAVFITALSDIMNINRDKFVDASHKDGDLFTSSLAYTLQDVRKQRLVEPGDIGLFISAGACVQVGCATYYF